MQMLLNLNLQLQRHFWHTRDFLTLGEKRLDGSQKKAEGGRLEKANSYIRVFSEYQRLVSFL
jgi:hypothetical protein